MWLKPRLRLRFRPEHKRQPLHVIRKKTIITCNKEEDIWPISKTELASFNIVRWAIDLGDLAHLQDKGLALYEIQTLLRLTSGKCWKNSRNRYEDNTENH